MLLVTSPVTEAAGEAWTVSVSQASGAALHSSADVAGWSGEVYGVSAGQVAQTLAWSPVRAARAVISVGVRARL